MTHQLWQSNKTGTWKYSKHPLCSLTYFKIMWPITNIKVIYIWLIIREDWQSNVALNLGSIRECISKRSSEKYIHRGQARVENYACPEFWHVITMYWGKGEGKGKMSLWVTTPVMMKWISFRAWGLHITHKSGMNEHGFFPKLFMLYKKRTFIHVEKKAWLMSLISDLHNYLKIE